MDKLLRTEVRWAEPRLGVGSGWAVICGAVVSGSLDFTLQAVVKLLLSLFLADGLLGAVWAEASLLRASRENVAEEKTTRRQRISIPYLHPGAGGNRLLESLGGRWSAWKETSSVRQPILGISIVATVSLALGYLLGLGALAAVTVGLVLALLSLRQRSQESIFLQAAYSGGLAWFLGFLALSGDSKLLVLEFGNPGVLEFLSAWASPIFWAAVYLTAFYASRRVASGDLIRGPLVLVLSQVVGVAALIFLQQPVLAGLAGLLVLPQILFSANLHGNRTGLWYLERIQLFAMATLLIGALGG